MSSLFAERMGKTPRSFIRETLKVTECPDIISFAGGLPNPTVFPVRELAEVAKDVISDEGAAALQYATTEGYLPLREWVADRYAHRYGLSVSPDEILITHGSQQCLDLCGKVFIDKGTPVAIEEPGYLGAIQAFSLYEADFVPIKLEYDGPVIDDVRDSMEKKCRFFYGVPNSQNPSGVTWSETKRREVAGIIGSSDSMFIEDDAYGEIRFAGDIPTPVKKYIPDQVVMNGSFSKIITPGMRMGWVCAPKEVMTQLVTAKQATDLHSSILAQRIISRYLSEYPIDSYIRKITETYQKQCECMLNAIKKEFPDSVSYTIPDGGMFIWVTLPDGCSSLEVFNKALEKKIAVLPGIPFYTHGGGENTMRLNFSNSSFDQIEEGIRRLSEVLKTFTST
ncbi:PLP-dependent aminotransferase family protein [Methanospirillum stamsii]|uniref:Aspartate aminotransferase n=1 Tax=Methanospirillum stamsii TaxID=1277351 RepID=A0A2V2N9C5_9EURY|nr:PLP-dependent aminotransferase family protein [Methanospirillum stamsii]PWR75175.1 aspartate aminotransferase [Methanospirillum stamsii]